MKYSETFAKADKNSKEFESKNATLLLRAGFVNQTMAGVYSYLPLGLRVLHKIEVIVREEMDKIGEEVLMPFIAPTEYWKKTGRLDTVDVIFKASGANERSIKNNPAEYVINSTHEDVVTPLVMGYTRSYKDFPFAVYQIQTKLRNEVRPKSGLLRGREFLMKDLYSFHMSEEDQMRYYNNEATEAYLQVFKRVGLEDYTYETFASGGDFTKEFSKEFQVELENGEDLIFRLPSTGVCYNREIAPSKAPEVDQDKEKRTMTVVETPGVIGMEELPEHLGVPAEKCMKTLIYETPDGEVIVAAVRGTYDINEVKLADLAGVSYLELASDETVRRVTGAEVGYAGVVGLPEDVRVFIDDSMENAVNFECGGNKTDHHNIDVNWDVDVARPEKFYDIKLSKPGDINPETGEVYETFKASEAGNIFPLGIKYSEAFGYKFTDKEGKEHPVYMGSYGIGISRLMGIIAEKFSDEKGLVWPITVTPYYVHLIDLGDDEEVRAETQRLYKELQDSGVDTLWDDRQDVSAGVKFNDSDLMGLPYRLVISQKTLKEGSVEIKNRNSDDYELVKHDDIIDRLSKEIKFGLDKLNS